MQDACDPPPHHIHPIVHHHPQAPVIGRIRRHGTHRLAQRLHAAAGVCPAGPPLVIGAAALKAVLPAMAFVGLTTLASSVSAPSVQPAGDGFNAAGAGAFGVVGTSGSAGGGGSPGVAPHGRTHQPHPPISVPEPASFSVLLLVTAVCMGTRLILRRTRSAAISAGTRK